MNLINSLKKTIFYLNPKKIKYCLFPSANCQFTHFNLDKLHPHAGDDRGFFKENDKGYIRVINSNWDIKGIKFEEISEYRSLYNHYYKKQKWRDSDFALRFVKYIKSGNIMKNFDPEDNRWKTSNFNKRLLEFIQSNKSFSNSNLKKIIIERENEINLLFKNIKKLGVIPCKLNNISEGFINNISINLGKNNEIFFNHRGHHRLAMSKILNIRLIPVKIAVVKNLKILRNFMKKYRYEKV